MSVELRKKKVDSHVDSLKWSNSCTLNMDYSENFVWRIGCFLILPHLLHFQLPEYLCQFANIASSLLVIMLKPIDVTILLALKFLCAIRES